MVSWSTFDPRKVLPRLWSDTFGDKGGTPEQRANLDESGLASDQFAEWAQGGVQALGGEAAAQREYLRKLASGENSLSAEQLRQGLQQNVSQQRSMAAGASPNNSAMAARTAAMQSARLGYGMTGQAATAGIQERNAAQQALADMILKQRQQDAQIALQGRANAISAYGGGQVEKSWTDTYGPMVAAAAGSAAKSDRRAKTAIKDGDEAASKTLEGLKSYLYKYKDEKDGKGEQFGPMAQELEKNGLGHAVMDTPDGKMVHGAKAALSGIALTAALARRVAKLEGARK